MGARRRLFLSKRPSPGGHALAAVVLAGLLVGLLGGGCDGDSAPAPSSEAADEAPAVWDAQPQEPATAVAPTSFVAPGVEEPGVVVMTPNAVPLGAVGFGDAIVDKVVLVNPGPGDARVDGLSVEGSPLVRATLMGRQAAASQPVVFEPPLVMRAGDVVAVQVSLYAASPGAFGAQVIIDAGADTEPLSATVSGVVDLDDIVAVPEALSGQVAAMPSDGSPAKIAFDGGGSASPAAPVIGYQWVVSATAGAEAHFVPNANVAAPILYVTKPGAVEVRLAVADASGAISPLSKPVSLDVVDETAVTVVAYWDGVQAADLDLHLLHPMGVGYGEDVDGDGASDGWFDTYFDCWEDNPVTYWPTDAPDVVTTPTPSTDNYSRDQVALPLAVSDSGYPVAVHFVPGTVSKTVKAWVEVRIHGALVWTSEQVKLAPGDLWSIGAVDYGGATFSPHSSFAAHIVPAVDIP